MKTTLLDDYLQVCFEAHQTVPAFGRMVQVIKETTPVVYKWPDGKLGDVLPTEILQWPDPAFMLWTPSGFMPERHRFAVDVDAVHDEPEFSNWFNRTWELEGVMVFTRPGYHRFDAIPVARQIGGPLILSDVQLSYDLTPQGWAWQYAVVGPNNWFFHSVFKSMLSDSEREEVDENVQTLGNTVSRYLGEYWKVLQQDGEWFERAPKQAKLKLNKEGKVRKVIRPGTLGHKEWKLDVTG
jgi:hypothetical protein